MINNAKKRIPVVVVLKFNIDFHYNKIGSLPKG